MSDRLRLLPLLTVAPAALLVGACGMEEYRNADLQLDVSGAPVVDEDRVRICVGGVGNREQAVGSGRLAFAGLPATGDHEVLVDLLDESGARRLGRAGPVTLGDSLSWSQVGWTSCEDDGQDDGCGACEADGNRAEEGASDRLLGVRFEEEP